MAVNWDWNTVSHYEDESKLPKSGEYVEISVLTNYGEFEEYQSIRYDFRESEPTMVGKLGDFRLEEDIPAIISSFKGYPSMSLMQPEADRVEAVEFAEEMAAELDEFLSGHQ